MRYSYLLYMLVGVAWAVLAGWELFHGRDADHCVVMMMLTFVLGELYDIKDSGFKATLRSEVVLRTTPDSTIQVVEHAPAAEKTAS